MTCCGHFRVTEIKIAHSLCVTININVRHARVGHRVLGPLALNVLVQRTKIVRRSLTVCHALWVPIDKMCPIPTLVKGQFYRLPLTEVKAIPKPQLVQCASCFISTQELSNHPGALTFLTALATLLSPSFYSQVEFCFAFQICVIIPR